MMTTCTWATEQDKHDLIDFIDYVFSKAHQPHDFATLLPKLYGEHGDAAPHHIVIREDGKITATMAAYPVTMRAAGEDVMTLGVGSVSVHPRYRGRGYMRMMMDALDAKAAELNAAFAVLGGQRQRYEYYGFEMTGLQLRATLEDDNVRHALRDVDVSRYALTPMTEAHVPAAMAIHQDQPCYCYRTAAQFIDILRTWQSEPHVILLDGEMIGYCAIHKDRMNELLLADESHLPAALKLLVERFGDLTLDAAAWQAERAALLTRICESISITPENQYKFYQPERVKALFSQLGPGNSLTWEGFTPSLPLYVAIPDRV